MTSLFEIAAIVQRQRRQPLSAETNRPPGALEVKVIDWGNRKHSHRARNVVKRIFLQPRHIREKNHIREKALLAISIWFNIWWQASSWFANPITGMNVRQVRVFMSQLYIRLFLSCHSTTLSSKQGTGKHHGLTQNTRFGRHGRRWRSDLLWKQVWNVSGCPLKKYPVVWLKRHKAVWPLITKCKWQPEPGWVFPCLCAACCKFTGPKLNNFYWKVPKKSQIRRRDSRFNKSFFFTRRQMNG